MLKQLFPPSLSSDNMRRQSQIMKTCHSMNKRYLGAIIKSLLSKHVQMLWPKTEKSSGWDWSLFIAGPCYWHGLTSISAWISNHTHSKVRNEIIYPFPNFNSFTVEVWEWISNFIPRLIMDVIIQPCWLELILISKRIQWWNGCQMNGGQKKVYA